MGRSLRWSTYNAAPQPIFAQAPFFGGFIMPLLKRGDSGTSQSKRQLPLFPYNTGGLAGRYPDSLIAWWSPAGVKAPVRRPESLEPDAEQRWEEEGGNSRR
jgi:hypothetical protein